jgi:hypothetical protein
MIPKWQKMEEDLTARVIIPATFNWPLQAKYFFYAHGGTLNMYDFKIMMFVCDSFGK